MKSQDWRARIQEEKSSLGQVEFKKANGERYPQWHQNDMEESKIAVGVRKSEQ